MNRAIIGESLPLSDVLALPLLPAHRPPKRRDAVWRYPFHRRRGRFKTRFLCRLIFTNGEDPPDNASPLFFRFVGERERALGVQFPFWHIYSAGLKVIRALQFLRFNVEPVAQFWNA